MEATSVQFSSAVQALAAAARRVDLVVPAFRSPPKMVGTQRSLQRHRNGSFTVAVRLKGRPWPAVLADMVEGVVAANRLSVTDAAGARAALWSALQLAGCVPSGGAQAASAPPRVERGGSFAA